MLIYDLALTRGKTTARPRGTRHAQRGARRAPVGHGPLLQRWRRARSPSRSCWRRTTRACATTPARRRCRRSTWGRSEPATERTRADTAARAPDRTPTIRLCQLPNASTGTKTDTPVMNTPLNVQTVTQQALEDQQAITHRARRCGMSAAWWSARRRHRRRHAPTAASICAAFSQRHLFANGFRMPPTAAESTASPPIAARQCGEHRGAQRSRRHALRARSSPAASSMSSPRSR